MNARRWLFAGRCLVFACAVAALVAFLALLAMPALARQAPAPAPAARPAPQQLQQPRQPQQPQQQARQPASAERGRQLAEQGADGVTACISCHGAQGEGNAAAGFPRLAGQPPFYLERQMSAFADGRRDNPVMSPIAKAMTAQQRLDSSAWYASVDPAKAAGAQPGAVAAKRDAARQKRALALANQGDDKLQVQACINCHGPNGAGEAPAYPYLAGQHAAYLTAAMAEWKSGARKTDPSGQMPTIAARLGEQDVAALAAFYAAQTAQAPALRTNVAAGSVARPAVAARADASGPRAGAAAPQGVGTEQGAPLTGGNQGQGGGGGAQGNQTQPSGQPARSSQEPARNPPPPTQRR
ncbi:c-type cytochrome [Oxalobacteraceae bacterium OTU3CINTB1]|nr:c-type cytochrome [Oxalobacteraceae bacterium OTU3CINTB1]